MAASDSHYHAEEGWLEMPDGEKLYTKSWKPEGQVKAKVVFVHGFSDHCNTYSTLFSELTKQGIAVYSWDQRGWGQSVKTPKQKGLTGPTSLVMSDMDHVINTALKTDTLASKDPAAAPSTNDGPTTTTDPPLFLMGHSMGGAQTLYYASVGPATTRRHIRGYLTESPFLALTPATAPWRITETAGRFASKILPHFKMVNPLNPDLLSRDQAVGKRFVADGLCHDTGTLEGLAGMLDRAKELCEGVVVPRPVGDGMEQGIWMAHGDCDGICDFGAVRDFAGRLDWGDKEFKVYAGFYHRLHEEIDDSKYDFMRDLCKWILNRSPA
ncbi:MAG: hypothetical protein M1831_003955 [Alyxoria varia]|nr:MAG: hypothetical protein M1831_003955 [Alyxoria varia]